MKKPTKDFLKAENCNTRMCKTCIFRTDGNAVQLAPGRMAEIQKYLLTSSSHRCHTTHKTCYGGLEWQAQIFFSLNLIPAPTVAAFLAEANRVLNL